MGQIEIRYPINHINKIIFIPIEGESQLPASPTHVWPSQIKRHVTGDLSQLIMTTSPSTLAQLPSSGFNSGQPTAVKCNEHNISFIFRQNLICYENERHRRRHKKR